MRSVLINVIFKTGAGICTASLNRLGAQIETHTIHTSGQIDLPNINDGDILFIQGAAPDGETQLTITNADSSTISRNYSQGIFFDHFTASDTGDTGPRFK